MPVAARRRVIVELPLPLGIILEEASTALPSRTLPSGSGQPRVVVSSVGAGSPASGVVRVGDVLVATSATFGDGIWPARSLDGAVSAIRSRCGETVKLVLERDDDTPVMVAPPPSRSAPPRHRPPRLNSSAVSAAPGTSAVAPSSKTPPSAASPSASAPLPPIVGVATTGERAPSSKQGQKDPMALGVDRPMDLGVDQLLVEFGKFRTRRLADSLIEAATAAVRQHASVPYPRVSQINALLYRLKRVEAPLTLRFYNNLMWSYVKAREPQKAVDVFDDLPNPNVECYTTLAKALGILRRPDDAICLLQEMRARAVTPNIRTYNAIIASCVRTGDLEKARALFTEMEIDGVSPNVVSWNIIMDWHARQKKGAARLAGAAQAFADMKASGVRPNTVTFTTMMKSYAASGAINKAEGIFAEMKKRFPAIVVDTEAYNTLLRAHSSRLDWRRCLELLDEMQLSGTPVSLSKKTAPNSSLDAPLSLEAGEYSDAGEDGFGRGGQSKSVSSRRNVLSGSAESAPRSGYSIVPSAPSPLSATSLDSKVGASVDREMMGIRPNAVSYSLVVKACADAGRVRIAETVFDEMLADGISPPPPHAVVSLMRGYASVGDFSSALEMLKQLKEWDISPNLKMMCTLMDACLEAGEPALALSIYARIKASGTEMDVVALTLLLRAYGAAGELDKAFNVLTTMAKGGRATSPNAATYNALIRACARAGSVDRALRALSMTLNDYCIDDRAYDALVSMEVGPTVSPSEYLKYLLDAVALVRTAGHTPNGVAYVALLEACEQVGAMDVGLMVMGERHAGKFRVGRATSSNARLYEESLRTSYERSHGNKTYEDVV